jgi:PAS domain S-box-containing protein
MMHRTSLRWKLFFSILLAALLPLFGAGWLLASTVDGYIRASEVDDAARVGQLARVVAAERGERLLASAQAIALSPPLGQAVLAQDQATLLALTIPQMERLSGPTVTVTDDTGRVLVRAYAPESFGQVTTKGSARALRGEALSSIEVGQVRGLAIRGYSPIENSGRIIGIVVVTQNLDQEFLASLRATVGLDTFAILGDRAVVGADLEPAIATTIAERAGDFSGIALVDGREQSIYAWKLTDPDGEVVGSLGVVLPLDALEQTQGLLKQTAVTAGFLAVLGSVLLAWLLSRLLIRPVERIAAAARAIAAGQAPRIPTFSSRDEVEDLSRALSSMIGALSAQTQELAQTNQQLAHFAAIVESTNEAVIGLTPTGVVESWNPSAERLYGYSAQEMIGQSVSHLSSPQRPEELRNLLARLERGERIEQYETEQVRKDGSQAEVALTVSPIRDPSGQTVGLVMSAQDISERRAVERLRDDFVSMVSHELRTPMNGVLGMTELLLGTDLTPEQQEYAAMLRRSGDGLLALINDILDFSKIEAGKLELEPATFDLTPLVDEVLEVLAAPAQARGLELLAFIEDDVPETLRGDPYRLRQILLNLVGNAVKFTERGEVVVRAQRGAELADGVQVRFDVVDSGIGIPPDAQKLLFQPFSQVHRGTMGAYGGTGLGLTICKRLVELMGGEIGVRSAPGHGSTFWFTARFGVVAHRPEREALLALRDRRVLILTGNTTSGQILQQQVAAWGMSSSAPPDAVRALEELRRAAADGTPYDIAIMDLHRLGAEIVKLGSTIRADHLLAGTRLVLLTALGQGGLDHDAAAMFDAILTKPLRQSSLASTLTRVLAGSAAGSLGILGSPLSEAQRDAAIPARPAISVPTTAARILVVDDAPINQFLAMRILAKLGYRVDVVASGREAVEALERLPYAAVLMDCRMPEMDGFAATREIRRREGSAHHTPIIAMTASIRPDERQHCLTAGMDDFIAKPFHAQELATVLQRWVPHTPAWSPADEALPDGKERTAEQAPLLVLDATAFTGLEPEQVAQLIAMFQGDSPPHLAALRQAVAADDAQALREVAHYLRGIAMMLGLRELQGICTSVEQLAVGGTTAGATELLDRLDAAFQRALAALADLRGNLTSDRAPDGVL